VTTTEPTRRVLLRSLALARSGDKGAHANVGVWTRDEAVHAFLRTALTAEVVAARFASLRPRAVVRYELHNLRAFNFVLLDVLGAGGGSASLRTDAQAKTYGSVMLGIELGVPDALLAQLPRLPPG
jgi:hypothetical protein